MEEHKVDITFLLDPNYYNQVHELNFFSVRLFFKVYHIICRVSFTLCVNLCLINNELAEEILI